MADTLPTIEELAEIGRAAIRDALDPLATGAVDLRAGSRNDVCIGVNAALYARLARYVADRVTASSPFTATGQDLDVLARDRYGEERLPAAAATGFVYLLRGGSSSTTIPKGSRFSVPATSSTPAVVFEASETVSSSATTATVPIICTEVGEQGNVDREDITVIVDTLPDTTWGFDPSPSSPEDVGGGSNEETDQELQRRLAQRSVDDDRVRGIKSAVLAGVLRVPGVAFATLIAPLDGTILVYAGDSDFVLSSDLKEDIETELLTWRAFGLPAIIRPYDPTPVTVTASIYMRDTLDNYDPAAIKAAAVEEIQRYFNERTNHDEYYTSAIKSAIFRAAPDDIQTVDMTLPSADVVRQPDTAYAGVTELVRYTIDEEDINLTVLAPKAE